MLPIQSKSMSFTEQLRQVVRKVFSSPSSQVESYLETDRLPFGLYIHHAGLDGADANRLVVRKYNPETDVSSEIVATAEWDGFEQEWYIKGKNEYKGRTKTLPSKELDSKYPEVASAIVELLEKR